MKTCRIYSVDNHVSCVLVYLTIIIFQKMAPICEICCKVLAELSENGQAVIIPCGHSKICFCCAEKVEVCPFCRGTINGIYKLRNGDARVLAAELRIWRRDERRHRVWLSEYRLKRMKNVGP
jgi:hypothetical protein